jgi:hypothetical protein
VLPFDHSGMARIALIVTGRLAGVRKRPVRQFHDSRGAKRVTQIEPLTEEIRQRLSGTGPRRSPEQTSSGPIRENNGVLGPQKTDAQRHRIPQQG